MINLIVLCICVVILIGGIVYSFYSSEYMKPKAKVKSKPKPKPKIKRRKSYKELLLDPKWKQKREQILKRDDYTCQWCGCKTNLNVHHKYYLCYPNEKSVDPWKYPDSALITICEKCHHWWHENNKIKWYHCKYK